jgi:hypothetical protein
VRHSKEYRESAAVTQHQLGEAETKRVGGGVGAIDFRQKKKKIRNKKEMETCGKKTGANNLFTWRNSVFFFNFTFSISIYIITLYVFVVIMRHIRPK